MGPTTWSVPGYVPSISGRDRNPPPLSQCHLCSSNCVYSGEAGGFKWFSLVERPCGPLLAASIISSATKNPKAINVLTRSFVLKSVCSPQFDHLKGWGQQH